MRKVTPIKGEYRKHISEKGHIIFMNGITIYITILSITQTTVKVKEH